MSAMARYKYIDTNPKLLPVDLARQLLPGTFEHALNHLLDGPIDLSSFDARFRNDETGAPAYPPAMLLNVVLVAYAPRHRQQSGDRAGVSRAGDVHRVVRRYRAALHDDCPFREHARRGHRPSVWGG